jgi:SAM-dependent methyltransferase
MRESGQQVNQRFFDALWSSARFVPPEKFNTWPLASQLAAGAPRRLEVGPGLRPRLPVEGTHFVDMSQPAVDALRERGGLAERGEIYSLPYGEGAFDLVCAFDVVEHVDDDGRALTELTRVLAPGAALILSAPLHADRWTELDTASGHHRRYDPAELAGLLDRHGLSIAQSAPYGMQVKSGPVLRFGMYVMRTHPEIAMNWDNKLLMPLALFFEKPLRLADGLIDTQQVDEALLVCRRTAS